MQGMIKHYFTSEEEAEYFCQWAKTHQLLAGKTGIEQAKVNKESKSSTQGQGVEYVVRLTPKQYDILEMESKKIIPQLEILRKGYRTNDVSQVESALKELSSHRRRGLDFKWDSSKTSIISFLLGTGDHAIGELFLQYWHPEDIAEFCFLKSRQDEAQRNLFHWMACSQNEKNFLALIELVKKTKFVNSLGFNFSIFSETDIKGYSLLQYIAYYQSADVMFFLLEDKNIVTQNSIKYKNSHGGHLFSTCLERQPEPVILKLIDLFPDSGISVDLVTINEKTKNYSIFNTFSLLTPKVFAAILKKMDNQAFQHVTNTKMNLGYHVFLSILVKYVIHEPICQSDDLLRLFFSDVKLAHQITTACVTTWLRGIDIPVAVLKLAKPRLLDSKFFDVLRTLKIYLRPDDVRNIWQEEVEQKQEKKQENIKIHTSYRSISLKEFKDPKDLVPIIWNEGFKSILDFRLLQKHCSFGLVKALAFDLFDSHLFYTGAAEYPFPDSPLYDEYHQLDDFSQSLLKIIKNNGIYLKILRLDQDKINEFTQQFKNYNYRPNLRAGAQPKPGLSIARDKSKATHKFHHLQNVIKDYTPNNNKLKDDKNIIIWSDKKYDHTKKMPVSMVDKRLCAPVFGEHDEKRLLVGVLLGCDDNAIIRTMLIKDFGTVARDWVGNKGQVIRYSREVRNINFSDPEKYFAYVNAYPYRVPELLTEFKKESLKAIVIAGSYEEKAVEEAVKLQGVFSQELKLDLPIVYYDRLGRNMRMVSPLCQQPYKKNNYPEKMIFSKEKVFNARLGQVKQHWLDGQYEKFISASDVILYNGDPSRDAEIYIMRARVFKILRKPNDAQEQYKKAKEYPTNKFISLYELDEQLEKKEYQEVFIQCKSEYKSAFAKNDSIFDYGAYFNVIYSEAMVGLDPVKYQRDIRNFFEHKHEESYFEQRRVRQGLVKFYVKRAKISVDEEKNPLYLNKALSLDKAMTLQAVRDIILDNPNDYDRGINFFIHIQERLKKYEILPEQLDPIKDDIMEIMCETAVNDVRDKNPRSESYFSCAALLNPSKVLSILESQIKNELNELNPDCAKIKILSKCGMNACGKINSNYPYPNTEDGLNDVVNLYLEIEKYISKKLFEPALLILGTVYFKLGDYKRADDYLTEFLLSDFSDNQDIYVRKMIADTYIGRAEIMHETCEDTVQRNQACRDLLKKSAQYYKREIPDSLQNYLDNKSSESKEKERKTSPNCFFNQHKISVDPDQSIHSHNLRHKRKNDFISDNNNNNKKPKK